MIAIAIHGGAGPLHAVEPDVAHEHEYRAALEHAVQSAHAQLQHGAAAVDAVANVIVLMKDSGLYNAGRGAVINQAAVCELDASIMDGVTGAAGAVARAQRTQPDSPRKTRHGAGRRTCCSWVMAPSTRAQGAHS
jgi:beta-aspartyl-peptidase (threonine type)